MSRWIQNQRICVWAVSGLWLMFPVFLPAQERQDYTFATVHMTLSVADYYNQLALAHPFFDQALSVDMTDVPMSDLMSVISRLTNISVFTHDGAWQKLVTIQAENVSLRSILRRVSVYGFLYEAPLLPDGDIKWLQIRNLDPVLGSALDLEGL